MRKLLAFIVPLLLCTQAFAQLTSEELKNQYERQVRNVGYAGLGVENIIDKWERALPEDGDMLVARYNYYLTKAKTTKAVAMDADKYLGEGPSLVLKNAEGKDVKYFEVEEFDDETFAQCEQAIDKAVSLYPGELKYRFLKLNALLSYEKGSPDIACEELDDLINYNYAVKPSWTLDGESFSGDDFCSAVQEYCYAFFNLGTQDGYDAFLRMSEKMTKLQPKNTEFITNIGSYWFVAKQDYKKAVQFYAKALKVNPKDYTAAKNCVLIARRQKDTKLEKKYLPVLIEATDSESEKASCQVRLSTLK